MAIYYAPGVYIEEPDRGPKPIEGVSTSVTAFIGYTEKAEEEIENKQPMRRSILSEAKTITNWNQYLDAYGGLVEGAYTPHAVRGFFENGGTRCYVISIRTLGEAHRAQALIEAEHATTKKATPFLFARAKKGGPDGETLSVDLQPVPDQPSKFNITLTGKVQKTVNEKTGTRDIEEDMVGEDGKPVLDDQGKVKTRKKKVDVFEDKIKYEDVNTTLSNVSLSHLPHWDFRDARLGNIDLSLKSLNALVNVNEWADLEKKVQDTTKAAKQAIESKASDKVIADAQLAAKNAAEKLAKFNDTATVFARTLGRAYDGDMINNKQNFRDVLKFYTDMSEAGIELWRGVETSRPVKLNFAPANTPLMIEGSKFNVDTDVKLLIAPDDQAELAAAEAAKKRFDVVRPEQYRGYGRKGLSALEEKDDVNLICAPDLMMLWGPDAGSQGQVLAVQKAMIEHCERMQFRFAILDSPPGKNSDSIKQWRMDAGFDPQHGHAALYYPWIKIDDPLNPGRKLALPPSGHIAGIYARSDAQRGVYKAPANENVNGVIDLEFTVNQAEQGMLNPIGINCIRKFPGRGIKVWGARTLALTDPSWRYVNVRRLFNFVEASIERATQWVVFEPNDPILWGKIRRDVNAFMRTVWLSGALFGNTPDEAFYVKCDEELNPSETRDQGYLFVEIGMAPVKPAEFVVFRISQWAGPNAEG